jgi:hypothetical protein
MLGVPGVAAVNRPCAGSLASIGMAAAQVKSGIGVGDRRGRAQASSLSPRLSRRVPGTDGEFADWMSATHPDQPDAPPFDMSISVGWNTANAAGISREHIDAWAYRSHMRAGAAIDAGAFTDEILPLKITGPDGSVTDFAVDEHPRRDNHHGKARRAQGAASGDPWLQHHRGELQRHQRSRGRGRDAGGAAGSRDLHPGRAPGHGDSPPADGAVVLRAVRERDGARCASPAAAPAGSTCTTPSGSPCTTGKTPEPASSSTTSPHPASKPRSRAQSARLSGSQDAELVVVGVGHHNPRHPTRRYEYLSAG